MAANEKELKVRKRNGSIVTFDDLRIKNAIERAAMEAVGDKAKAEAIAEKTGRRVIDKITSEAAKGPVDIETIQNAVENCLMEEGYGDIAKGYILYRHKRAEIRRTKAAMELKDDLKLSVNAMEVLRKRYLLKDDNQRVIETPTELFRRVARHVASAESGYESELSEGEVCEKFYEMMRDGEFLPNSPTLMNAGTSLGQLSACFVLPVEDSMDGIFESLKNMSKIHQSGGGTGFNFSKLRAKGSLVNSTKGQASGPVSFMTIFDRATGIIVQGGRRRGANMGVLRCDHPDIVEFIEAKSRTNNFENFNLSVAVTDEFMRAVKKDGEYYLIAPETGKRIRTLKARFVFGLIANAAWRCGDPGLIFIDEINRHNPLAELGKIEVTNPCGELPLLPYESCNMGSINLAKMVSNGSVDWEKLAERVSWGIRFLDNVIDVNKYPMEKIAEITRANRKIGLGVMGFADMLIKLGIGYNSDKAVKFASILMRFIREESVQASAQLAIERGCFENFAMSVYGARGQEMRNATLNTVAPTGTISIISDCASGIEPIFAISYVRNVLGGAQLFETNKLFAEECRKRGLNIDDVMGEISQRGSIRTIDRIPDDMKQIFVTAFDVSPFDHLAIEAAFQKQTDNAVSKTINLASDATVEDVRDIYLRAFEMKCKGITVYRYGSKPGQVLSFGSAANEKVTDGDKGINVDSEYAGGCAKNSCCF